MTQGVDTPASPHLVRVCYRHTISPVTTLLLEHSGESGMWNGERREAMARERCTELCTRATTGSCRLCEALDASDAFWRYSGLAMVGGWLASIYGYVTGPDGWRAVGVIIGAYIGLYAIMEAQHERQMNRVLFEQSRFMTLAASGSPGGLNAALAEYQTLKAREVLKSPDIWRAWTWAETERVNEDALNRWAKRFFAGCPESWCGQGLDLTVLRKGELGGADLRGAQLQRVFLSQAQLQTTDFSHAQLQNADLSQAQLQNADLSFVNLQNADLGEAQLQDVDLSSAQLQGVYLSQAQLQNASLVRAQLQRANLRAAQLQRAVLLQAQLQNADLRDTDLRLTQRLTFAQTDTAIWDETTIWPDKFIPPCSRQDWLGPCAFLDLLSTHHLLLPALDRFVPRLHHRIPEHSSDLAGSFLPRPEDELSDHEKVLLEFYQSDSL